MHYGTFFFANIVSVSALTLCISLLALWNRRIVGMRWFAAALIVGLAKLTLQGLEGKTSVLLGMASNELYLISLFMQYVGLRWFVVRSPLQRRWPWVLLALLLAVYTALYLARVPYSANVLNIPFVLLCAIAAGTLLRYGSGPFAAIARITAAVLLAEMCVSGYRAVLTNLRYMRPWQTVSAHADPYWLYSLAVMAFLATFMALCEIGLMVVELERELSEQAHTDPLTGALNRRSIEEAAVRETARCQRHGSNLCMIMLDVDNFKGMNDTRGHAAGDRALQALAHTVKSILRTSDFFARTGGEEFTILLPGAATSNALSVAERIRAAVALADIAYESGPLHITVSVGVTQLGSPTDNWEAMMRRADAAMYAAKQKGRNRVASISCVCGAGSAV